MFRLQVSSLTSQDATDRLSRANLKNYQCSLRNCPEERRSQYLHGDGSLKLSKLLRIICEYFPPGNLHLHEFHAANTRGASVCLPLPNEVMYT